MFFCYVPFVTDHHLISKLYSKVNVWSLIFLWGRIQKQSTREACNFIKKVTLAQVFFCEFCEISKNTFSSEHLRWLLLHIFERFISKFNSSSFWGISASITAISHQSHLCTEILRFWNPCCNFLWPTCTSILSGSTYFETLAKRTTLNYFPFL